MTKGKIFAASLVLLSGAIISQSIFAGGCTSLANTSWTGQAKLITKKIVPVKVTITSVSGSNGFFELKGTINNEPLTGMFGCTEHNPGTIGGVTLDSANISIMSIKFSPDAANPTKFLALGGRLQNSYIDTTTEPGKNYLIKN